jgi:hypothetical protein
MGYSARFLLHLLLFLGFLYGMLNAVSALWSRELEIPFRRRNPLQGRAAKIAAWCLIVFSACCLWGFVTLVRYSLDPASHSIFLELLRGAGLMD